MKNPIILTTIICLTSSSMQQSFCSCLNKCSMCFDCMNKAKTFFTPSTQQGQTPIVNVYVNSEHNTNHSANIPYQYTNTYNHIPNTLINDINSANLMEIELSRLHNANALIHYSQQTTTSVTTTEIIEEISPVYDILMPQNPNTILPTRSTTISKSWPYNTILPDNLHLNTLNITTTHSPVLLEYEHHN